MVSVRRMHGFTNPRQQVLTSMPSVDYVEVFLAIFLIIKKCCVPLDYTGNFNTLFQSEDTQNVK